MSGCLNIISGLVRLVLLASLLLTFGLLTEWAARRRGPIIVLLGTEEGRIKERRRPPRMIYPKGLRLTDVVIPLVESQLARLKKLFDIWDRYPPCHHWNGSLPIITEEDNPYVRYPDAGHNLTLTISLAGSPNQTLSDTIKNMYSGLSSMVKGCFHNIQFHYCSLPEAMNNHIDGSRLMFEQMLNGTVASRGAEYALLMEPDLLPIRKNWLSALDMTVRSPVEPFWVRGSIYRGYLEYVYRLSIVNGAHINGNAIYNLADHKFANFYYQEVIPTLTEKKITLDRAFDTDPFIFMRLDGKYDRMQEIAQKFQFTNLIRNHYLSDYSVEKFRITYPQLYLVHGGNRAE